MRLLLLVLAAGVRPTASDLMARYAMDPEQRQFKQEQVRNSGEILVLRVQM
eukprot:SAG31_NODE_52_length_30366_cov_34.368586_5_plen_51_part_00